MWLVLVGAPPDARATTGLEAVVTGNRKPGAYNRGGRTLRVDPTMNETVWFTEPIEHGGSETDRLVVEDVDDQGEEYEFRTPDGETLTVPKSKVERIE